MKRTRTALAVVVVLIGVLAGASLAVAQTPPPPPTPAPAGSTVDAEPETQTHVVTTGAEIVATVTNAGAPVENAQVFWTETGPGELVETDNATDADGQARAVSTSRQPGTQTVTVWLDAPAATCPDTPANPRCDNVTVEWVAKQSANQPALECSGGATALETPILTLGEIPYEEVPCPEQGSTDPDNPDPTVVDETILDAGIAEVLVAQREFGSDYAMARSSAAGVVIGNTTIEAAGAFARSECSPNGVASQEQGTDLIVIKDNAGTPDDPTDDSVIFSGTPSPNTEIPLGFGTLILNEQDPEGGTVGPELPGEKQNRHAEGSVTAVHLTGPLEIRVGHARSDITCKQHTFAIDVEPEDQTAKLGETATVTATVRDEAGRPVQGEDVTWSETGPGDCTPATSRTDENGQATATCTSTEPGDQTVTGTLSDTTTKCSVAAGGVCSDSVVIHWMEDVDPPGTVLRVFGHAHTDYDGDNKVHLTKNDRGDVHIGAIVRDDLADAEGASGRLGYWDLRADPPGPMKDEFRCEHFGNLQIVRSGPPTVNQVTITGTVGRCNKSQRDPSFSRFEMIIRDNGPNPPNQDNYRMTFFRANGTVVYQWQDQTTVGLGDLTIDTVTATP